MTVQLSQLSRHHHGAQKWQAPLSHENSDTATREITITENGKAVLVGDVDGDGKVNVADHVELSKIIMEQ